MALIEVSNLEKIYETEGVRTSALSGVSFNIQKGEFVAIMGHSGSGKSTLLHILGFLDRQTSGEYKLDGRSFFDYSEEEIACVRNEKLGFVFQSFNLLPKLTVLENVKLPLLYSKTEESLWDKLARKAIDDVGLSHRSNHEGVKLSGGEKQRAAIARALVNNPQIIFADEPTGNLDSKTGGAIMDIIKKLNKEQGRTIILITHEEYISKYAERIIKLKDGKIEHDSKA